MRNIPLLAVPVKQLTFLVEFRCRSILIDEYVVNKVTIQRIRKNLKTFLETHQVNTGWALVSVREAHRMGAHYRVTKPTTGLRSPTGGRSPPRVLQTYQRVVNQWISIKLIQPTMLFKLLKLPLFENWAPLLVHDTNQIDKSLQWVISRSIK